MATLTEKYAQLDTLLRDIAETGSDSLSDAELVDVAMTHERIARSMESVGNRVLAAINQRGAHHRAGYVSLTTFLSHHLRITDPVRRGKRLDATHPGRSLAGEVLTAPCPHLAEAIADGAMTADRALTPDRGHGICGYAVCGSVAGVRVLS